MENEKLFEFMTKMYSEMKEGFEGVNNRLDNVESDLADVKKRVVKIEVKLEQDIEPKMEALFDGYKQNSDKLDRIEKEVSKQEEVILRRIK